MLISLYVLRLHVGPFLFGTLTVMFLFLLQFLMNNLDKLIGKGLDNAIIMQVIGGVTFVSDSRESLKGQTWLMGASGGPQFRA